jgi:uncharacterized protein YPO0396
MFSLFSTSSEKAGFRLQFMEVYNWGTFHEKIFRINPQGNNSLLTGANASGKSTYIDALLTLMVPVKKDRFYNQSSGVDKKGDRTEETYVCGQYGNIQKEGEFSTTTQKLRDKSTYSVLLASFSNTDQRNNITIFQVRWFNNGELKRAYGVAHEKLEIEKDFSQFDKNGNWKKRLEKSYNLNNSKKKIEFFDGPTSYADRIANLFGMRSTKALSLFNQVVGVKVLEDLDEFIRTNMLEEQEAEAEFIQLKESFVTLMDAKTNIEKAKEQILQLTPINEIALKLSEIQSELLSLNDAKETAVYWFAKKGVELSEKEKEKLAIRLEKLNNDLNILRENESELKNQETDLTVQIKSDEVGNQIEKIKSEIKILEKSRDKRKSNLDAYNLLAQNIEFNTNPSEDLFNLNREKAISNKSECELKRKEEEENLRQAKNTKDAINGKIKEGIETIQILKQNMNNIPNREAEIRYEILEYVGATKEEIPFIGELIKVSDNEKEWELSIEKVLHNFALRLIVPEKYYAKVNEYVNKTNLRGRIIYQRYNGFTSLKNMIYQKNAQNSLINKIEFKPKSNYIEWLEDIITNQFNYSCVKDLTEFNLYDEKAMTKEGLIKFTKGKHEKDDRPQILGKENYLLGWDNNEKIRLLQIEIKELQEKEKTSIQEIRTIEQLIKKIDKFKEAFSDIFKIYTKYDDIDWQSYAIEIQNKEDLKTNLEKTNNRVQELQKQLKDVQDNLKHLSEIVIKNKDRDIFHLEGNIRYIENELNAHLEIMKPHGTIDFSDFENSYPKLHAIEFSNFKIKQADFQKENSKIIAELEFSKRKNEDEVKLIINDFKHPDETITSKFTDWRSDVSRLPDSTHLEFIGEYQMFLKQLKIDNLPKYEKKFNEYLQETITGKIGNFRIFFTDWSQTIKDNIRLLNESLKEIDFQNSPKTYIQLVAPDKFSDEVKEFKTLLHNAIPNFREIDSSIDGRKNHFYNHIEPLISKLDKEDWRKKVMEVRSWFSYKAEEFYKETNQKFKTYENMGQLSGGEKAQLTYTILGSAIAYQFGLTKEGLQSNSFRFIAIDEAFKSQDEDKARYLITLCKQLHLQLLVVTPSDNIHIVENDISYVHFVERKEEKYSWLYDMPIEQFQEQRTNYINQ